MQSTLQTEQRLTLFEVEQEKLELIAFREECETDEERAAVDKQIQEYIGREIRKVSGIAALLKYFKAQAATAKAEEERAAKWRKRWESSYERLKNMVHGVMMALDLPKVEGATDRFRRQKNPIAVEITDAQAIPEKYLRATVKMTMAEWKTMIDFCEGRIKEGKTPPPANVTVTSEVDTAALKAACCVKVPCLECAQTGGSGPDPMRIPNCQHCGGTGMVLATVPGARLVQGEHLRIE